LSHSPSPFCFGYILNRLLYLCPGWLGLRSSYVRFPCSYDDRCVLSHPTSVVEIGSQEFSAQAGCISQSSQVARITGVSHCAWPEFLFLSHCQGASIVFHVLWNIERGSQSRSHLTRPQSKPQHAFLPVLPASLSPPLLEGEQPESKYKGRAWTQVHRNLLTVSSGLPQSLTTPGLGRAQLLSELTLVLIWQTTIQGWIHCQVHFSSYFN
jgi:hypothetical protein